MALISCPECNREISDQASYCPQCGYPIAKHIKLKNSNMEKVGIILKDIGDKTAESVEIQKKKVDSKIRKNRTRREVIFSYGGTYKGLVVLAIAIAIVDVLCVVSSGMESLDGMMNLLAIPLVIYLGNYILFKIANRMVFGKDENAAWKTTKICSPFALVLVISLLTGESNSMSAEEWLMFILICYILCVDLSLILMYIEIMKTYFWYKLRAMDEYDIYYDKCEEYRQLLIKRVQTEPLSAEEKRKHMDQMHQIIVIKARLNDRDIDTLNMVKEKERMMEDKTWH